MPALVLILASSVMLGQGSSLAQGIVQNPDIRNGYEDYLRAVEMIDTPIIKGLLGWYRGMEPVVPEPEATPAQLQATKVTNEVRTWTMVRVNRELASRAAPALSVLRIGNSKQVYDPRQALTPETLYPELAPFKTLAKVVVADAYVKFADGNPGAGTQSLLDGLTFAHKISGSGMLPSLVGIASTSIVLAGFETHLGRLSVGDCKKIETVATGLLAEPNHMLRALRVERDSAGSVFDYAMANPRAAFQLSSGPPSTTEDVLAILANVPASRRPALREQFLRTANQIFAQLEQRLKSPEREWLSIDDAITKLVDDIKDPALKALVQLSTPVYGQALVASAKQRTQLRLLDLHARVLEYRWVHARLPAKLADAAGEMLAQDPLTGEPFQYELRAGNTYRLYSKGTKEMGELELRYKRAQSVEAPQRRPTDPPTPPEPKGEER
jgi:hypothetical protein